MSSRASPLRDDEGSSPVIPRLGGVGVGEIAKWPTDTYQPHPPLTPPKRGITERIRQRFLLRNAKRPFVVGMTIKFISMRVIHIIPSAFEYFDDIRSQAFKLLDGLHKLGVETEAFTLQYGSPNKAEKASIKSASPSVHNFIGDFDIGSAIANFSDFDIIHLHCPFFGAAGKILQWKKLNPNTPLVVTYYRDVRVVDLMSLFIRFYNAYYLPKIFKLADATIRFKAEESPESIAADTLSVYNSL